MNTQPEALRLAEQLDREWHADALNYDTAQNAAAELRRLSKANQELLEALERIAGFTLSQFMGPHNMAMECVTVACAAIAKHGSNK